MGFLGDLLNPKNVLPGGGFPFSGGGGGGGGGSSAAKPPAGALPYWFNYGDKYTPYPGTDKLMNLLANPGQTNSDILNRSLLANTRGTQQQQTAARGRMAASGFGNSGLGEALQAAIGQAGQNRETGIYQDDARRREDLLRQDLGFYLDAIINPELATYGANKGVSVAQSAQKSPKQAAGIGAGAGLLGMLALAFCATAEELYGEDADETTYARLYMGTMASPETRAAYGTGRELADRVKSDPALRAEVKPIFDGFVREARAVYGGR